MTVAGFAEKLFFLILISVIVYARANFDVFFAVIGLIYVTKLWNFKEQGVMI
jgi:hypothetical protein